MTLHCRGSGLSLPNASNDANKRCPLRLLFLFTTLVYQRIFSHSADWATTRDCPYNRAFPGQTLPRVFRSAHGRGQAVAPTNILIGVLRVTLVNPPSFSQKYTKLRMKNTQIYVISKTNIPTYSSLIILQNVTN